VDTFIKSIREKAQVQLDEKALADMGTKSLGGTKAK